MTIFIRTLFAIVILVVIGGTAAIFWNFEKRMPSISYNEFLVILEKDEVTKVHLKGGQISLQDTFGREFSTFSPDIPSLLPTLMERGVIIHGSSEGPSYLWSLGQIVVPILLILVVWFSLLRKSQASEEDTSTFAKDKLSLFSAKDSLTFRDVAGIPEAKEELLEIVDFLQRPKDYNKLGAAIPRGILFQGPPGTGKTMLARAVAGEAGVPFYSISGSDFVEMFVGVGASRVRDLFKEAKKNTPCIVFIDEIDAVGGHRSAGASAGGQDERGQTLNALLVELDGFSTDQTIITLAATNRPDILDPALLRPGRFDRQINIVPPDVKGRLQILEVYANKMVVSESVDLDKIARGTPGFTGAELASLMNEAALIAGRSGDDEIKTEHFEVAKDRILMGIERKGLVISDKDRETMAYHEAGHAILAKFLPETDPLHKITIIPRGKALGHTQQLPLADRHAYPKEYILSRIKILMGGRAAEEICLHQQTTGAEDDFRQAVELATKMVCKWGMSDSIGPMSYLRDDGGFLGEQLTRTVYSEETGQIVDREIKKLVEGCYREAKDVLSNERDFLIYLADMLLVNETLDKEEIEIIYDCTTVKRATGKSAQAAGDGMAACARGGSSEVSN